MKYALLLLSLVALHAQAQIIYTDVIPDQTFPAINDTCFLDLNNDGITDFMVQYRSWSQPCPGLCSGTRPRNSVTITPVASNAVADTLPYASQLPPLQPIDATLSWSNTSGQYLLIRGLPVCAPNPFGPGYVCFAGQYTGQWISGASVTSSKFLGLRFDSAGSSFYGWARLSIPSGGATFTLKDYAYNSVPDEFILAGDSGSISTGLAQQIGPSVLIVPNPTSGKFAIDGLDMSQARSVEIRDVLGQEVYRSVINGPQTEIDLSTKPDGVYFLTIRTAERILTRKLIKQ